MRGLREWGASAALAYDPRPETEIVLALALPSWDGATASGVDVLLTRETLAGWPGTTPGMGPGQGRRGPPGTAR